MPKILELKEIDGALWCRVGNPPDFESGITLWTPDEQLKNFQAGLKRAAETAEFLSDTLVDGLEDTASQSERDYAERKAVEIQQAILKEIIP